MIIARYTLELRGETEPDEKENGPLQHERVLANMPAVLEDIEENTNDLLPEGYIIKIEEKR